MTRPEPWGPRPCTHPQQSVQLEVVEPMAVPTLVNVLLALLPRVVMAVMHTTMIRASMTAYSTAVGPSSRLTKSTTKFFRLFTAGSFRKPVSQIRPGLEPLGWALPGPHRQHHA